MKFIDQNFVFISDIMKDIETGVMMPAPMQRPYAWSLEDVEALANSMIEGIPIGSFLLWRPNDKDLFQEAPLERLGPLCACSDRPQAMILDGHNRLASLAWLVDERTPEDSSDRELEIFRSGRTLVIDGTDFKARFVADEEVSTGLRMPFSVALSTRGNSGGAIRSLWKRAEETGFPEKEIGYFLERYGQIEENIRNSRSVVTTLISDDREVARNAFLGICRAGVPMTREDFDRAVNWLHDSHSPSL